MLCAMVLNGIVAEIRDLTDEESQTEGANFSNVVDITNANPFPEVGWVFNGMVFAPPPGASAVPSLRLTKLAFLNRFTDAEVAAIETFAFQNNAYAAALRGALRKQQVSNYMDLARTDTIVGVNNLVALGLITPARAAAILTTPPTDLERYKGIL